MNTTLGCFCSLHTFCKVYALVRWHAVWKMLSEHGVPSAMTELLESLHGGMVAEVMVNGATTLRVSNGLRQGCTIAPTLFNPYFNLIVEQWREQSQAFGAEALHRCSYVGCSCSVC